MTCPADLHTHTTASDGQYTPSQLAAKALAAGIQILAVTDHDTMDGAEEAVRAAVKDYYDRNHIPYGDELTACQGHCDTCGHCE